MFYTRLVYTILFIAALVLFVIYGGYLFLFLLLLFLVLPVLSLLSLLPVKNKISIRIAFSETAVSGGNIRFAVLAENNSIFPCPYLQMLLDKCNTLGVSRLGASESEKEKVRLLIRSKGSAEVYRVYPCLYCGKYELKISSPCMHDMLGLFSLPVRFADGRNSLSKYVYVYPKSMQMNLLVNPDEAPDSEAELMSKIRSGDDRSEIFQNREYREGDPIRDIHWKLSARNDELIVKEYSRPLIPSVHFLLELQSGVGQEEADRLLSVFYSAGMNLLTLGKFFKVSFLYSPDHMETLTVSTQEDLHSAVTRMLSMPGTTPWSTLEHLLLGAASAQRCRFVYLFAGFRRFMNGPKELLNSLSVVCDSMHFSEAVLFMSSYSKEFSDGMNAMGYRVFDLDSEHIEEEAVII